MAEHRATLYMRFVRILLVLCLGSCNAGEEAYDTNHLANKVGGSHLNLKEGSVMGNYEAGQKQVLNIQRDSQHPKYGRCWINALETVSVGCKRLTDDEQSRMALRLANCHLAKAGFETYPCDENRDIRDCLNPMKGDSISFNTYTEFFTHTQDICFFLQSQVWHQHTEDTVEKLAQSSENVAVHLEVTGKLQEDMMKQQNESLKNQKEILAQEAKLNAALKSSTNSIQEVFAEMKSSTLEQKALFAETFDRVAQVQKLMLGEFTWFNSVVYYVMVIFVVYMVTATHRTASARFPLFLLLLVNWFVEWGMFRFVDSRDQTIFHANTWWCRKLFCCLGILLLIYRSCQYKDYNQINHSILLQIQKQLQQGKFTTTNMLSHGVIQGAVERSTTLSIASPCQFPGQNTESNTLSRNDMTGFSSDSGGDATYIPEILASSQSQYSSSSDQSYTTADQPSRKTSTADQLPSTTPTFTNVLQRSNSGSSTKRKRGRPKGSKNRFSREGTPISNISFQSPYNLRQRAPQQPSNPVLDLETTLMFAEHVESLANRHFVIQRKKPKSTKRSMSPAKSTKDPAFFSSDDDM